MERVIYSSTAASDTTTADVFEIIEASERNNPDREITGFLLCHDDRFLQLIEGPEREIVTLLNVLKDDPRHHTVEILEQRLVTRRMFPDWSMKQLISFNSEPALVNLRTNLADKRDGASILSIIDQFLGN